MFFLRILYVVYCFIICLLQPSRSFDVRLLPCGLQIALAKLGAILVTLNPAYRVLEAEYAFKYSVFGNDIRGFYSHVIYLFILYKRAEKSASEH